MSSVEQCPLCGGGVIVISSRAGKNGRTRRRKCVKCDHRYSTVEMPYDLVNNLHKEIIFAINSTRFTLTWLESAVKRFPEPEEENRDGQ